jgi:hypothetical protein
MPFYAGQPRYRLRTRNNEFGRLERLGQAIAEARALGKKFYLVSNVLPHNAKIRTYLAESGRSRYVGDVIGWDAVRVAKRGPASRQHRRRKSRPAIRRWREHAGRGRRLRRGNRRRGREIRAGTRSDTRRGGCGGKPRPSPPSSKRKITAFTSASLPISSTVACRRRRKSGNVKKAVRCCGTGANPRLLSPDNSPYTLAILNQCPVRMPPSLRAKTVLPL